jgi:hypothetical protein
MNFRKKDDNLSLAKFEIQISMIQFSMTDITQNLISHRP